MTRASAAEVYLIEQYDKHIGTPIERRNKIFTDFIALGMRKRWAYHKKASDWSFSAAETKLLRECRSAEEIAIADWLGEDLKRVVFATGEMQFTDEQLELMTGWGRNNDQKLVLEADQVVALPECVYSMSAFDDPNDVEEARQRGGQSAFVSGVYWIAGSELKIKWVDEYGETIREKVCDVASLEEGARMFDEYTPFESSWWTEATKVGKYAGDD